MGIKRQKKLLNHRFTIVDLILFIILAACAFSIVFPFYTSIVVSIMSEHEYLRNPFTLIPKKPELDSYKTLINQGNIISGYTKAVEALVIAGSLGGGVGLTLSYFL